MPIKFDIDPDLGVIFSEATGDVGFSDFERWKISLIWRDTARYFSKLGRRNTTCGQSRWAREEGMAEWMPNLRAS